MSCVRIEILSCLLFWSPYLETVTGTNWSLTKYMASEGLDVRGKAQERD